MKYSLLTQEQFEALHFDFAKFLASQQIDAQQWGRLKKTNDAEVQKQLASFSDLVWEEVLRKVRFLAHYDAQSLNLLKAGDVFLHRFAIKIDQPLIDLRTKEGVEWLLTHLKSKEVHCYRGLKTYEKPRNMALFALITQGAIICDETLYKTVEAQVMPDSSL